MMNTEQILKVLKNERECIKRQSEYATAKSFIPKCNRDCANCDLCLPDTEILEVYDFLINAYSMTEVHIKVSQEEADKLIEILNRNAKGGVRLAAIGYPDTGMSYPTFTIETAPDETAREIFHGICPYTNIKCEKWTCSVCKVEKRERKFMEGDTE